MPLLLPHIARLPGPLVPAPPSVATPLGVLDLRARLGGWTVPPRPGRVDRLPTGALIHHWEHPGAELELLLCPFRPRGDAAVLPAANCWGAVWRIDARAALSGVRLTASFRDVPAGVESEYAGSQGTAAVELWDAETVLHLGGPDAEDLYWRAELGGVPAAWARYFDTVDVGGAGWAGWGVEYLDDNRALRWTLPALEPGDHAFFQTALAWRTRRPDDSEYDERTLWAVQVGYERVLEAAAGMAHPD
ncbi:hypothetical protein [Kitasatospora sp. NPDC093806]|uniref:hypothetical protein n=1 Tax=Kitasatospora sp. NPDC093806 TaxID=3155075 RepID=UPI0034426CFC